MPGQVWLWHPMRTLYWTCLTLALATPSGWATTNAPGNDLLLLDKLGHVVNVPTNQVPPGLLPPPGTSLAHQMPQPTEGASQPTEVRERAQAAAAPFRFLPSVPPPLAPYLASQDEFGNTAVQPGALLAVFPLEPWIQGAKYQLSEAGLRYSLEQTLSVVQLTGVMQGEDSLAFYTLDLKAKWALFSTRGGTAAGWLSSQIEVFSGLNPHSATQDAGRNLGTLTDPTGLWCSVNGIRVPELAWQQSLREGEIVALAGIVNQGNYLDQNAYAQTGRREFNNSALIDNLVLPIAKYNFGLNLQWQPHNTWYAMLGASLGKSTAGQAPWTELNLNTWSVLGEFGYTPSDFLGLGPGIYRLQPFVAQVKSPTQGGVGFDFQQQLGRHSPLGWFSRCGVGGEQVSRVASAQASTGLVVHAPLSQLGVAPRLSNDLLGLGLVWCQASAARGPAQHRDEYVLESFYALQLSPTLRLIPDLQFVWNPAFNSKHDQAAVFQLQVVLTW